VELCTSEPANVQLNGKKMDVILEINTPEPIDGASISFQALNSLHQPILHVWTFDSERPMCREPGVFQLICHIPKVRLYMGQYTLTVHFSERAGGKMFQTIEGICPFQVAMYGQYREFEWQPGTCTYLEEYNWEIKKYEQPEDDATNTEAEFVRA
jgi:lipopolysaccharide transport system ATP-binding protein